MDENRVTGSATDLKGQIKEGVGSLAGDTKLQAEGRADQVTGSAERAYGQAKDTLRDAADAVQSRAATIGEYIDDTIQDRPLTALLAAGAVGYILSLLVHRR